MSALSERYDGLAPATRSLLLAHSEFIRNAGRSRVFAALAGARLSTLRDRWVLAGAPDLDTEIPNVAELLKASQRLHAAVQTFLLSPSPLASLFPGCDDMGITSASRHEASMRRIWAFSTRGAACTSP